MKYNPFNLIDEGDHKINLEAFDVQQPIERLAKNGTLYKGTEYTTGLYGSGQVQLGDIYVEKYIDQGSNDFYVVSICGIEVFCSSEQEMSSVILHFIWYSSLTDEAKELGIYPTN